MSTFFEIKDRRVVPNFRSFKKTIELGELNSNAIATDLFQKDDLTSYYKDFFDDKTVGNAGDLLSAAVVNNILDAPSVIEAAKFIYDNQDISSVLQISIAEKVLNIRKKKNKPNIDTIEDLLELGSLPLIHDRIRRIKLDIRHFERNPFLYTELARLYSIIGQKDSAIRNVIIAKSLAPHNRYVLRSYARLMAHFGDIEAAHDILKSNNATRHDPWLLASEIAFASLRNKSSNFLKIGNELISSKNFSSFNTSELASSIGTVELFNGNRKKSKSLLQSALISPNDNSLAQIEWINNKEDFFDLDITKIAIDNKFEALTLDSYDSMQWELVVKNAEKWFIDMPFAKRPIMYGHHSASFFLDDQETAIKFCKVGLISSPNDPQIMNNIAYSYAMNNNASLAFNYLNKIDITSVKEEHTRICLLATTGLAYFRSGLPDLGREFYLKAIQEAKNKNQNYYSTMALLNITREEILLKSNMAKKFYDQAMKIETGDSVDLRFLKDRIKDLMLKQNL